MKDARKKLETPMAPAMLCKASKKEKHGATSGKSSEFKTKLACIASESTGLRLEESLPNHHEDPIAGKGDNSLQHNNLVHKFIPRCINQQKPKTKIKMKDAKKYRAIYNCMTCRSSGKKW